MSSARASLCCPVPPGGSKAKFNLADNDGGGDGGEELTLTHMGQSLADLADLGDVSACLILI